MYRILPLLYVPARAILSPTIEQVNKINNMILFGFNALTKIYNSIDTVLDREKAIHYLIFKFFNTNFKGKFSFSYNKVTIYHPPIQYILESHKVVTYLPIFTWLWPISFNLLTSFLLHMPTTPLFLLLVNILTKLLKYFRIEQIKLTDELKKENNKKSN